MFVFLFIILCLGSLFLQTEEIIDTHILPKWLSFFLMMGILGLYVVWNILHENKYCNIRLLYQIIICLCICQAGYGFLQYFDFLSSYSVEHRVTGSFDNPAGFAGCLCSGIPFCLYLSQCATKKIIQHLYGIAFILIFAAVCLSQSRTGIISIIVVLLAYMLLYNPRNKKVKIYLFSLTLLILLPSCYFFKKGSADGRLLIWQVAWSMIEDSPFLGHGAGGIETHYMDYQAKYFKERPEALHMMLADNVKQVFNEYLALGVRFGIIGWITLMIFIFFLAHCYRRAPSQEGDAAVLSLISIGAFSCFSYPLTYPFVWIVLFMNVSLLISRAYPHCLCLFRKKAAKSILTAFLLACSFLLIYKTGIRIYAELEWGKIYHQSLYGETKEMLPRYQKLMSHLGDTPYFLYNYAVELYIAGYYAASLKIVRQCRKYWADYDLELLYGEILCKLGKSKEAEEHYLLASKMCPVRFVPLYRLYEIYKAQKQMDKAQQKAKQILGKPVKVDSPAIREMKQRVLQDLEKEKSFQY